MDLIREGFREEDGLLLSTLIRKSQYFPDIDTEEEEARERRRKA